MPHVDLPQGRIAYTERGSGRPVVFVHGLLMGGELWHELADRLAPHGLRCIMPTWPLGAHRTPLAAGADNAPRGVAAAIAAFLEALDLDDVVLVGNDSGGMLCQLVAIHHPERVGALVLTNCDAFEVCPPRPFGLLVKAAKVPRLLKAALAPYRIGAVRRSPLGLRLLSHRDIDPLWAAWLRPHHEDGRVMRDTARFTAAIDKRLTLDAARELHRFDRPVLLAWGAGDMLFRVSLAERLRAAFGDARLEKLDARCLVMVDRPDELAALIADFTRDGGSASPASPDDRASLASRP
jgi:pimeloyl-ACP methyl ester carboxylesterase